MRINDKFEVCLWDTLRRFQIEHGVTIFSINTGFCEVFAEEVVSNASKLGMYASAVWLNTIGVDMAHCVVEYCGKYYDSITPEGVDDPEMLNSVLLENVLKTVPKGIVNLGDNPTRNAIRLSLAAHSTNLLLHKRV